MLAPVTDTLRFAPPPCLPFLKCFALEEQAVPARQPVKCGGAQHGRDVGVPCYAPCSSLDVLEARRVGGHRCGGGRHCCHVVYTVSVVGMECWQESCLQVECLEQQLGNAVLGSRK